MTEQQRKQISEVLWRFDSDPCFRSESALADIERIIGWRPVAELVDDGREIVLGKWFPFGEFSGLKLKTEYVSRYPNYTHFAEVGTLPEEPSDA